ncbi:MAG: cobaltochelatase subunit CobN [Steroidobacteraceae bacterium]
MASRQRLSALLLLLLLPLLAQAAPVRIAYLYSDGNIPGTLRAYDSLLRERPDLKGELTLSLMAESTAANVAPPDLLGANVLVLDVMNQQLLEKFNATHKTDLLRAVRDRGGVVLGVGRGLQQPEVWTRQGVTWDNRAQAYWQHSGSQNQLALMKLALTRAGVKGLQLPDPQLSLDFGYYYPDGQGGRVFADWASFDAWRRQHGKLKPGAPRVAISFFKATFYSGDTALLDALVAAIEKQGGEAIPVFGYPGIVSVERLLKADDGSLHADVVLGSNFNFSDAETAPRVAQLSLPVINIITLYGRSAADWRASPTGLSSFEGTFNLAVPEFAGTIAPTVVGTKEKMPHPATGLVSIVTSPVADQVQRAVSRALRIARLRTLPNADKRIALLYYNYPPGKAGIGASYLNVAESIANIVAGMGRAGYDIGGAPPDAARVLQDITGARNVAGNAPGELQQMLAAGTAVRIPMAEYRRWLQRYPQSLQQKIIKDWGDPEKFSVMVDRSAGAPALVVPVVRYGKLTLLPQPQRAWGEDLEKLYHAKDLAPHHQYLATYAWLRDGLKADAVVHLGTHGTLEWLDGKDAGLSPEDAPDALIADLPNLYVYNVDVVGEGLVARRRSEAVLVDHMVPSFRKGGLAPQLARLTELMNDHSRNEGKNPELAATFAKQAREEAIKLGIARELKLDPARDWSDEELHRIENYLLELRRTDIPYGLHAFGRTPPEQEQRETAEAIAAVDRSLLPDKKKVLVADMQQRIAASGPQELASLLLGLSGRALPSGTGGEPLRNPDSYPTGKNFFGIDPDKVPKPASWELGVKLADQMLAEHVKEHGRYPEKISFVIWGDETMRHEGVMESEIFHLLGTKPVWDARGKVVDVQVIPRSQLKRPRVDIVIASAAEGMFSNVTHLMDEAVQKVKAMDEADNLVRKHYLATRAALIAKGRTPDEADRLAGVRIFDEPPGQFNLNTSSIVAASGSWDSDAGFANDYMRKMGHGYGNGFNGEPMEDVFRMALAGTEKVVHSSSTTLYGALDNDDMYMYMGGLASAIKSIDGKAPELLIANTRDPSHPEMTSASKFVGQEFRSRYVNPVWIEGMQREGYAGAGEMRSFVEYLWGWNATTSDVVNDGMWQEVFNVYVEDSLGQHMKEFFEKHSPFAYQDMVARMLETTRKGYWKADAATRGKLAREYVDSVTRHGVNCTELSCGNARLLEYVLDQARQAGVAPAAVENVKQALEKAMGRSVADAARELRDFAAANDAREQAAQTAGRAAIQEAAAAAKAASNVANAPAAVATAADVVRGYVMQEHKQSEARPAGAAKEPARNTVTLVFGAFVLALLLLWRWRAGRGLPRAHH